MGTTFDRVLPPFGRAQVFALHHLLDRWARLSHLPGVLPVLLIVTSRSPTSPLPSLRKFHPSSRPRSPYGPREEAGCTAPSSLTPVGRVRPRPGHPEARTPSLVPSSCSSPHVLMPLGLTATPTGDPELVWLWTEPWATRTSQEWVLARGQKVGPRAGGRNRTPGQHLTTGRLGTPWV